MKNLSKLLIIFMLFASTMLSGCGKQDTGTPPEVLIDGMSVFVEKPADLEDKV